MSTTTDTKLYFFFGTRAMRPQWLANELGISLKLENVRLPLGEHKKEAYLSINPRGQVPTLVDGSTIIEESLAILQYLGDKYGKFLISPKATNAEKAAYYQALIMPTSYLDEDVLPAFLNTRVLPQEARQPSVVEEGAKKFKADKVVLRSLIKGKKFVAGDQFTIADVGLGYTLNLAENIGWLDDETELKAYIQRLRERPAFQRTWDRKHADYKNIPEN